MNSRSSSSAGAVAETRAPGAPEGRPAGQRVLVISGLSGAGKTSVTKLFEDLGYTCVDNLPTALLPQLAELVANAPAKFERVAIVVDARAGDVPLAFAAMMEAFEARGIRPQVLFLEARDDVLIRRFSETRHRHPLSGAGEAQRSIEASIAAERAVLADIRERADVIVDTSDLSYRELRERIAAGLELPAETMGVQLVTFGYKHGIPLEADLVFDTRFIQNPYYVPELREHSGLTDPVREFVMAQPGATEYADLIEQLLEFSIPAFAAEGKSRLTIGIGCTGGRHRSIVLAEELARRLRDRGFGPVEVLHRELERA
jgi:RNase adapter protein RapZ